MNFAKRKKAVVDVLFILALLAVFMVSALFVVLFGTKVYSKTVEDSNVNFSKRTAFYYIATKLNSHKEAGAVSLGENEGEKVLELRDNYDGNEYITHIYEMDGYIKEITTPEGLEFDYSNGNNIIAVNDMDITFVSDNLMKITITDTEGNVNSFFQNIILGGSN